MTIIDLIEKKKRGENFEKSEIDYIIEGVMNGSIPDYQLSALLMAIYFKGMTEKETLDLTLSMAKSGDNINLDDIDGIKLDKHSTGGVGDKTTLIVVSIVAALGVKVAKMSGRGLGHTGGTVDKMEGIPGLKTDLDNNIFIDNVNKIGAAVVGQSGHLAPADKKIYAIRDVTATVDSIPLIASSIMSKKIASAADAIVLDVKVGSGAFMKSKEDAIKLAELMVKIGKGAGKKIAALVTNMDEPLGYAVGNRLEIKEVVETLQGKGPSDLEKLCLSLASEMLLLKEDIDIEKAREKTKEALKNGKALDKFIEIIQGQGGKTDFIKDLESFTSHSYSYSYKAKKDGIISHIYADKIGKAAGLLGAGRKALGDKIDQAAGIVMRKKVHEKVYFGEEICYLQSDTVEDFDEVVEILNSAFEIGKDSPKIDLILEVVR